MDLIMETPRWGKTRNGDSSPEAIIRVIAYALRSVHEDAHRK